MKDETAGEDRGAEPGAPTVEEPGTLSPDAETLDAPTREVARSPSLPPATAGRVLARGAALGRYVILSRIGSGGMGVVYAAYDPELDRKVAVKLLRAGGGADDARAARARTRLHREAQALAKLSHPNVIAVHDVGTFEGGVFVAMEFVVGRTLDAWLREAPRSFREIVRVLASAGRGLAAAHAVGIVHRDFKPSNVLVGDDGRVRVLDFGLARRADGPAEGAIEDPPSEPLAAPARRALDVALTQTGALLGTPRYMSPEQFRDEEAGPASDQFSFCVALYEALYGEPPFEGSNVLALARAIGEGRVREAPRRSQVPAWLRRVVLRGLSVAPEARYPSMAALLAELERDPARSRRAWIAAAALGLIAAAGASAYRRPAPAAPPPCTGAERKLAGVWDEPRRQAVRAAFVATGKPLAADTAARVEAVIDGYAQGWVRAHTEACEATRVRGEQSERLLDLRIECLERRRKEIASLGDLYLASAPDVQGRALKAAYELGNLDACAQTEALAQPIPPPTDAAVRARVDELTSEIARIKVLSDAGRYDEALQLATAAAASARALGYRPVEAEALFYLGDMLDNVGEKGAERTLEDAMTAAMAGHDDVWLARAATDLVWVVGLVPNRQEEAHRWGRLAQAAIDRLGGNDELAGNLANNEGTVYQEQHDYARAGVELRRALELRRRVFGPGHPKVARALFNLGNLENAQHRYGEARPFHTEALALLEKTLGPEHPDVAQALNSLGVDEMELGHLDEAIAMHTRALAIRERMLGPGHFEVGSSLFNLANTEALRGRDAEAIAAYEKALAILEKTVGPNHPWVAGIRAGRAVVLLRGDRRAEAIAELERSLVIHKAVDSAPVDVARAEFPLAKALWDGGDRKRAVALAEHARAAYAALRVEGERAEIDAWLASHPAPR